MLRMCSLDLPSWRTPVKKLEARDEASDIAGALKTVSTAIPSRPL